MNWLTAYHTLRRIQVNTTLAKRRSTLRPVPRRIQEDIVLVSRVLGGDPATNCNHCSGSIVFLAEDWNQAAALQHTIRVTTKYMKGNVMVSTSGLPSLIEFIVWGLFILQPNIYTLEQYPHSQKSHDPKTMEIWVNTEGKLPWKTTVPYSLSH